MTDEQQEQFVETCINSKAKLLISGYDNDLYNKLTDNGFEKFARFMRCSRVQKHLRTAHTCRVLAYFHVIVKGYIPSFNRFEGQKRRHNFHHTRH